MHINQIEDTSSVITEIYIQLPKARPSIKKLPSHARIMDVTLKLCNINVRDDFMFGTAANTVGKKCQKSQFLLNCDF